MYLIELQLQFMKLIYCAAPNKILQIKSSNVWNFQNQLTGKQTFRNTVLQMGAELPTDMKQGHGGEARITHHPERSGERGRRKTLWCNVEINDRLQSTNPTRHLCLILYTTL